MGQPIQKIEDIFCLKHINDVSGIGKLPDSAGKLTDKIISKISV